MVIPSPEDTRLLAAQDSGRDFVFGWGVASRLQREQRVLAALMAGPILGEYPNAWQIFGIVAAASAVYFVTGCTSQERVKLARYAGALSRVEEGSGGLSRPASLRFSNRQRRCWKSGFYRCDCKVAPDGMSPPG